jgi:hypothetical protein
MDVSPRLAATQASRSLASSSRTWFSTGINNTGFFIVISFFTLASNFSTFNSALSTVLGNRDVLQQKFYFPKGGYFPLT